MKMYKILIFFCCIGISQQAVAQKNNFDPAVFITTISFQELTGGIIMFRVQLDNNKDSINLVLDTGSGGASLDSITSAHLGLKILPSEKTLKGIAGVRKVDFTYGHSISIAGLKLDSVDFHINDYDLLSSVYGIKIDGIIGYSFLKNYILNINYDTHIIEIYTPGKFEYNGGVFLKTNFFNLPVTQLIIKDAIVAKPSFIFDIGAGLNLLLSSEFVNKDHLIKSDRKLYPTQAEGVGGKKNMYITVIKQLKVGPYTFRNVPTHVFDDEYNVTNFPLIGGIIGNDILRRFNVILNYPEKKIYIKPNTRYYESFDYSYSGLGIYLVNNAITVVDIIANSPGEKAGLKSGDVIVSVGNKIINNIQTLKSALQNNIGNVKMIVLRQGVPEKIVINIKDIRR